MTNTKAAYFWIFLTAITFWVMNTARAQAPPFVENKGQWPADVRFRADIPGGYLYIKEQAVAYAFYDTEQMSYYSNLRHGKANEQQKDLLARAVPDRVPLPKLKAHGVSVSFLGANVPTASGTGDKAKAYKNYFLGKEPKNWGTRAASFPEVQLAELYPGIGCRFLTKQGSFKYEFLVEKGADPRQIQLHYQGSDTVYITNGQLHIRTSVNTFTEERPYAYQTIGGARRKVPVEFQLDGDTLSFLMPDGYNKQYPLVIDPVLVFSTFSGSISDNWANTATYDNGGSLYAGGTVFGENFPFTQGAYQVNYAGQIDAVVMKFDSLGQELLYSTFLGGSQIDVPHSLLVNNQNQLLVLGTSSSSDFPVTAGAFDTSFGGGQEATPIVGLPYEQGSDLTVSCFSASGDALVGSTYLGGSQNDGLNLTSSLAFNYGDELRGDLITDSLGNVYLTAITYSADFPTTPEVFQPTLNNIASEEPNGRSDAIVSCLSPDLTTLLWSTYFGSGGDEVPYSIKLATDNDVIVSGGTTSLALPTTENAIVPNRQGGGSDGFLLRISGEGQSIEALTYLGTTFRDMAYYADLDPEGNVAVIGLSFGSYPVTEGVYNNPNSGQFIHKLSPDFTETIFSTVVGAGRGQPDIAPTAFLLNECGNIYVAGWGGNISQGLTTNGLPVTPEAFQRTTDGNDFYLMMLKDNGRELLYATFLGGNTLRSEHVDGGTCRFDPKGTVYHAVCSCQDPDGTKPNFPVTAGAYGQTHNSNNCNIAAFKFDLEVLESRFVASNNQGCVPLTIDFENTSLGESTVDWSLNGTPFTPEGDIFSLTFDEPGIYTVSLVARNPTNCLEFDVATEEIQVFGPDFSDLSIPNFLSVCPGETIPLEISGGFDILWESSPFLDSSDPARALANPTEQTTFRFTATDANGCTTAREVRVAVEDQPQADFSFDYAYNCGEPPKLTFQNLSENARVFRWDFGNGQAQNVADPEPVVYDSRRAVYTATLTAINENCIDQIEKEVPIEVVLPPNSITPNGDGLNDTFVIDAEGAGWRLYVYNRWGKLVYASEDYADDWGAEDLSGGTYYYILYSPKEGFCKGNILVLK